MKMLSKASGGADRKFWKSQLLSFVLLHLCFSFFSEMISWYYEFSYLSICCSGINLFKHQIPAVLPPFFFRRMFMVAVEKRNPCNAGWRDFAVGRKWPNVYASIKRDRDAGHCRVEPSARCSTCERFLGRGNHVQKAARRILSAKVHDRVEAQEQSRVRVSRYPSVGRSIVNF